MERLLVKLEDWGQRVYNATCDKLNNVAHDAFLVNARSVAHVIATTAESTTRIDAEKATGSTNVKAYSRGASAGIGVVNSGHSHRPRHQER